MVRSQAKAGLSPLLKAPTRCKVAFPWALIVFLFLEKRLKGEPSPREKGGGPGSIDAGRLRLGTSDLEVAVTILFEVLHHLRRHPVVPSCQCPTGEKREISVKGWSHHQ